MAQNVIGLFDSLEDARGAVQEFRDAGFPGDAISFVTRDAQGEYARQLGGAQAAAHRDPAVEGVDKLGAGGIVGGIAGLLIGLAAMAIPGVGPVIATGTFATFVGAGMVGAVAGGILGTLIGLGISEKDAHVYAEGVRRGGALVMVQVEGADAVERAAGIFRQHHVVDVDRRRVEYQQSGWTAFDPNADPAGGAAGTASRTV